MPKTVVVTGGSRGIGRATAERLARLGLHVACWSRSADDAPDPETSAGVIEPVQVDVRSEKSVESAVERLRSSASTVSGLVLNAGVGEWDRVEDHDTAGWIDIVDTNLLGAFRTLKHLHPLLVEGDPALVVVMASDSGSHSMPTRSGYCASKAGLASLANTFRRENRGAGVRVTTIHPSRVDTYFRGKQPGTRPEALSMYDVADVVGWLFSLPRHVEIQDLSLGSIHAPYGNLPEFQTETTS